MGLLPITKTFLDGCHKNIQLAVLITALFLSWKQAQSFEEPQNEDDIQDYNQKIYDFYKHNKSSYDIIRNFSIEDYCNDISRYLSECNIERVLFLIFNEIEALHNNRGQAESIKYISENVENFIIFFNRTIDDLTTFANTSTRNLNYEFYYLTNIEMGIFEVRLNQNGLIDNYKIRSIISELELYVSWIVRLKKIVEKANPAVATSAVEVGNDSVFVNPKFAPVLIEALSEMGLWKNGKQNFDHDKKGSDLTCLLSTIINEVKGSFNAETCIALADFLGTTINKSAFSRNNPNSKSKEKVSHNFFSDNKKRFETQLKATAKNNQYIFK